MWVVKWALFWVTMVTSNKKNWSKSIVNVYRKVLILLTGLIWLQNWFEGRSWNIWSYEVEKFRKCTADRSSFDHYLCHCKGKRKNFFFSNHSREQRVKTWHATCWACPKRMDGETGSTEHMMCLLQVKPFLKKTWSQCLKITQKSLILQQ